MTDVFKNLKSMANKLEASKKETGERKTELIEEFWDMVAVDINETLAPMSEPTGFQLANQIHKFEL